MQETKEEVSLPHYKYYNKNRATSKSGGLYIGIHRTITLKVGDVNTECEDIQALRIKSFFDSPKRDLLIVNIYDSPKQSSYKYKRANKNGSQEETLEFLHNVLVANGGCEIILLGDFNARTANANYCHVADDINFTNDKTLGPISSRASDDYYRVSQDHSKNSNGTKLIDMLKSTDLTILNGNTLGDVTGKFTCNLCNGSSVVDYIICSEHLTSRVLYFRVQVLNTFSDHCPLTCSLDLSIPTTKVLKLDDFEKASKPYTWCKFTDSKKFQHLLSTNDIKKRIYNILQFQCTTKEDNYLCNEKFTELLKSIASQMESSNQTQHKRSTTPSAYREPWFDKELKNQKSLLNKLRRWLCKNPHNQTLRYCLFARKKEYQRRMHVKKEEFIKFEVDDNISLNNLQCLKRYQEQKKELDIYDTANFIEFFKRLYQSRTLQDDMLSKFEVKCSLSDKIECELNSDVSIQEVEEAIRKLNTGKAVSTDGILNEFLINANPSLLEVITKIFNSCHTHDCYPWNTSLSTPLHKKGDRYDPNNYRAIAVGSNLDKLFSSILLHRLLRFRENNAPNPPNQQGFCKGGQTLDHILCMNTCINKYTAKRKATCLLVL